MEEKENRGGSVRGASDRQLVGGTKAGVGRESCELAVERNWAMEGASEMKGGGGEKELDEKMAAFPEEALEHVLAFIDSHKDRNAVSQVCKSWYRAERWSRRCVFIGNCYAVSPKITVRRFPKITSLTLKGKPRFADFDLLPPDWGADAYPWILELANAGPFLEELRLKRMTVKDDCLELLAHSFPNFRVLVLTFCEGLSTHGLARIVSSCRNLTELDLQETVVDERVEKNWLDCFPDTCASITSLNFACLASEVSFEALERLVARCSNLKSIKLNQSVTLRQMQRLLSRAPQLNELGTGSFLLPLSEAAFSEVENSFNKCLSLRCLSGFCQVEPLCLPLIYPVCAKLTFLNLSYSTVEGPEFSKLISHCRALQRLWVQDSVEDRGLEAAASTCTELLELRVFPTGSSPDGYVTDKGILAISRGCPNLKYVLYFCKKMTNAAVEAVAKNCPKLTHFRLCILTPRMRDYMTQEPMDEAFAAIVKNCKNLQRLSISGWLTDRAFEDIGRYGKNLKSLSVAFAGDSDTSMQHVLQGCKKLRKLEIRDSPFGDRALFSGLHQYPAMRFLWMSGCKVTIPGCRFLAYRLPYLNVEIIKEGNFVEKLYAYRSVVGPRTDSPNCVWTL